MKTLKAAVIGVGSISYEHINGYIKNPNVELYAFCDINEKQLKLMAEKFNVPEERCFADKDEMFKALPEIDIVSVTTWNSAHAECTIAALNAGKDVICEKPMAMNTAQANAMLDAAKKNGKHLQIGFVRRYGNDADIMRDFINADKFGDIYYAKATYLRRNGNPGGWFGDKSRSGGGPLIDLGVHVIDLSRYLCGNPKPVSVYGATFQKLYNRPNIKGGKGYNSVSAGENDICDVEDLATALIRFDNGLVLSVEASFSLNIKNPEGNIQFFGTKAGAKLDPQVEIFTDENGHLIDISFNKDTGLSFDGLFCREIDHFVDCVLNGTPCKAPAEDGVEIMKILDAIYESARTGHEVIIG
ncbi:MAG: Gfo/Idh/MocA family oxidoreductase [Clostridia bacterium]|nr:Gfo/Idh/MocA family oxidoreductase [Clostridia bacterium]